MKSFIQYLAESTRDSFYVVKLASKPTDQQVDTIHKHLEKYKVLDLAKPEHVEHDAIDFYDNPNKDIWAIKFRTAEPVSSYMVMQGLKAALNIPEEMIVVRGSNEPYQLEADDCEFNCATDAEAHDRGLVPAARLSTDRFYHDAEQPILTDLFGNEYNKSLLDYLGHVAESRPTDHYEPSAPLFSWIDMDKVMKEQAVESDDFNAEFDTPKPVSKGTGKDVLPVAANKLGPGGNLDDAAVQKIKLLKKQDGKREAVTATRAKLKAEK